MTWLVRGLEVLQAFAGTDGHRTAAEISKQTGLSRAVIRRCLCTLSEAGYVTRVDNRYRLEAKVLSLAQSYDSAANSLPAIAAMNVGVQATRVSKRILQTQILATLQTNAQQLSQRFDSVNVLPN